MSNQISNLEQLIISEIEERKKVMLRMKTLSSRYTFRQADEELFFSYSIPIIYSLWEGFIVESFRIYIQEINKLNLSRNTIYSSLLVYYLERRFKQFQQYPEKPNGKIRFFNDLLDEFKLEIIELDHLIDTQSNVGFDVLNGILKTFNLYKILPYRSANSSIKDDLDNFLLKIRNSVAHGQNSISISKSDLERAIVLVEELMDLVFERIKTGYHNRSYLLPNSTI